MQNYILVIKVVGNKEKILFIILFDEKIERFL